MGMVKLRVYTDPQTLITLTWYLYTDGRVQVTTNEHEDYTIYLTPSEIHFILGYYTLLKTFTHYGTEIKPIPMFDIYGRHIEPNSNDSDTHMFSHDASTTVGPNDLAFMFSRELNFTLERLSITRRSDLQALGVCQMERVTVPQ